MATAGHVEANPYAADPRTDLCELFVAACRYRFDMKTSKAFLTEFKPRRQRAGNDLGLERQAAHA